MEGGESGSGRRGTRKGVDVQEERNEGRARMMGKAK